MLAVILAAGCTRGDDMLDDGAPGCGSPGSHSHRYRENRCKCDDGFVWEDYDDDANFQCLPRATDASDTEGSDTGDSDTAYR